MLELAAALKHFVLLHTEGHEEDGDEADGELHNVFLAESFLEEEVAHDHCHYWAEPGLGNLHS